MKAAVWTDYGKIEVKEVPDPVIGEGEVLLKVRAAGVCMTDLHVYTGEFAYKTEQRLDCESFVRDGKEPCPHGR